MPLVFDTSLYLNGVPGSGGGTVDQTYDPTSANAQSGVAVAQALATVSVDVDGVTVTKNASDELQASAVMNARTGTDVLPIWQGTQQQWTEGVGTDWYNWTTPISVTASTLSLPFEPRSMVYGNNILAISNSGTTCNYSTDTGATWSSSVFNSSGAWEIVYLGNNKFVASASNSSKVQYSTDGCQSWTEYSLPSQFSSGASPIAYGNNIYITMLQYNGTKGYAISTDDCETWTYKSNLPTNLAYGDVAFGAGKFVAVGSGGGSSYVYSEDGDTWVQGTFPVSGRWSTIQYINNLFIITPGSNGSNCLYSSDGINWNYSTLPVAANWNNVVSDGNIIYTSYDSNNRDTYIAYSIDGCATWQTYKNSGNYVRLGINCYANDLFISTVVNSTSCKTYSFSQNSVYTLDDEPTTSSTVYSAPNTTSALIITSVGTGTITLSDNNTYTYTQSGDEVTYQNIGEAHPTWLCNVNGVGVKVGNTLIADNTDTSTLQTKANLVTSVDSSSTDMQYPSAKLFYDTCGDIETLINNL